MLCAGVGSFENAPFTAAVVSVAGLPPVAASILPIAAFTPLTTPEVVPPCKNASHGSCP